MVEENTYHPPSGRSLPEELARQAATWVDNPILHEVLEAVDGFVILANQNHQILLANLPFLKASGRLEGADLQGWRLGEALGCVRVPEGSDGCGTSPACAQCGIAKALSDIRMGGLRASYECLLTRSTPTRWEAMELRVKSTPFPVPGADQILLVCQDISAEKRREVLESVFFHDVLNTLSGLRGWTHVLKAGLGDTARAIEKLDTLSARVLNEIRSHRLITQAERGELAVKREALSLESLLTDWQTVVEQHPSCGGRTVIFRPPEQSIDLHSDPDLVRRILLNMALNALEATDPGGTVTAWAECARETVTFCVHNPREIPQSVAQHVFQRSYSTKAVRGRGLGTYSMKLFGESFLGGKVTFTTSAKEGTVFRFALPNADGD
jgi:signal transduction histidine kinase